MNPNLYTDILLEIFKQVDTETLVKVSVLSKEINSLVKVDLNSRKIIYLKHKEVLKKVSSIIQFLGYDLKDPECYLRRLNKFSFTIKGRLWDKYIGFSIRKYQHSYTLTFDYSIIIYLKEDEIHDFLYEIFAKYDDIEVTNLWCD